MTSTALSTTKEASLISVTRPSAIERFGIRPTSLEEVITFARIALKSSLIPKEYAGREADVILAICMGSEVGLAPMQALQSVAVINGKAGLYGDGMLAVCRAHPSWRGMKETHDEATQTATCVIQRAGEDSAEYTFSVSDAKTAKLWGKSGPWTTNPKRMLQMRARGFALRDKFADVLKGLVSAEELQDYPVERIGHPDVIQAAKPATDVPSPSTDRNAALLAKMKHAVPAPVAESEELGNQVFEAFAAADSVDELDDVAKMAEGLEPRHKAMARGLYRTKKAALQARDAFLDDEPAHDEETGEVVEGTV